MSAPAEAVPARGASRLDGLAVGVMLLLCMAWGVQQVASKVALTQGIPPIFQALVRSMVAGPLVVGWLWFRRGRAGLVTLFHADGTLKLGMVTAVLFAGEFILLFEGMRRTSASQAVIMLYTAAFFTAAGAHYLVPGERLRPVNVFGLMLAFLGVAATMGGSAADGSVSGDLMVLGAAAAWGATTVIVKQSRAMMRAAPEKVLAYQHLGAVPLLFGAALISGQWHIPDASTLAWLSLLYQCVVVAFASYLTWIWLIGRYPAGRLAAFSFLTPLLGVIASALLLGDAITPLLLVGLVCVGAGLRLINR
ncbi:MAG: DMT family transporter [Pseudomonadota bacterium]|nr:DMT family transporter [Pseudomonadota bacterium]